jgi:hypothetical protein
MEHYLDEPEDPGDPEGCRRKMRNIFIVILLCMAAWAYAIWLATGAFAHTAQPTAGNPLGWKYGLECCSLIDCSQAAPEDVRETKAGYVIVRTGELIPYGDSRIKFSKDEFFHRCTPQGNLDAKRSICLYIPDRGY